MCTILTLDYDFYDKNRALVHKRIKQDARSNGDGWCLFLAGESDLRLNTQDLSAVFKLLTATKWQRMFLHSRFATVAANTIVDTHGWTSQDGWLVMHNGILHRSASDLFRVDSQLIVSDIDIYGIEVAVENLMKFETYANVFLINPVIRKYVVTRSQTNTLFTDYHGNYSTAQCGGVNFAVPLFSTQYHRLNEQAPKFNRIWGVA